MLNKVLFILIFLSFYSCRNSQNDLSNSIKTNTYTINGEIFDKDKEIIYLKIITNNSLTSLDSSIIQNNSFLYKGTIDYPHKAILQIKNSSISFPFILANEQTTIKLNTAQMSKSSILNSPINTELKAIQTKSAAIYQNIDYLFPQLQKARMENDFESLDRINTEINAIIAKNQDYLFSYIQKHPSNHLSSLLLNDLWQSVEKDSIRLIILAKQLDPNIQKILNFSIH